ncbi:MAG: hypothetical protein CMJ18_23615, partial [Phycisphaeraceae bacterium]|nr:hypothetical protein [Phycisphaeraceae bacterium]
LLASAYNVISVGEWHGDSSGGDTRVEKKGRCKPDIVAPGSSTSFAVPAVTASAARLLETADGLDRPAARQAEVIKAVLLAGAAKTKTWTRHDEKPLDDHFGAGRLDVDTSHRILTGVAPVDGRIPGGLGWHFGRIGPGEAKSWPFELDGDAGEVSLVLVWHRRIFGRNVVEYPKGRMRWSDAPRVADLDLGLAVAGAAPPVTVARSVSRVDNVEHVYLKRLDAGAYEIEISRTDTLSEHWDFALAWRIDDAPGGDDAARGEAQPIPGSSRVHAQ